MFAPPRIIPRKALIPTEFCSGFGRYYGDYRREILKNLTHGVNAICEWNLLLNDLGAPYNHRSFGCVTPIYYDTKTGEVKKRAIYNHAYMFSHYIHRGAKVLHTSSFDDGVLFLAVKNLNGNVTAIAFNHTLEHKSGNIKIGGKLYPFSLLPMASFVLEIQP